MTRFEGPVRQVPRAVTREEAIQGIRALAFLYESGRISAREAIGAADNIFIDMGLGHVALPYLEIDDLTPLEFLGALRAVLADDIEEQEPFRLVGPRWPFAY